MRAATLERRLEELDVLGSISRQRASNNNPYSESLFRTVNYRTDYPCKPFESKEQTQQVQGCGTQRGHHPGAITPVSVGILMELGVSDPVPALNAPALAHQLQQGVWGGAQAGVAPRGAPGEPLEVGRPKRLAITASIGAHLHDPAGTDPGLANVLWCLFRPQRPGDVAAMADFVIRCHERELALSLKLRSDLTMQRLLVALDGQQEFGPLLLELPKNGRWVWSASAWMSTPPRSSWPSSCLSTARSWLLEVG